MITGKLTSEITVSINMQSEVNSKSNLYVIASTKDSIPEGIAASMTEMLNCRSTRPKYETKTKAIAGKINNFMKLVNIIMFRLLINPLKSIEIPKDNMIKGMAPFPR